MKIKTAVFAGSSTTYVKTPTPPRPEVALVGRSNVGKSSLINMLLGRKQLAKTSRKPGKTRLINHFLINDTWYLVDLPGYGWAQVSRLQRKQWSKMIEAYLLHGQQLRIVMVLVDARQGPQKLDIIFINWLGRHKVPFCILLTKSDKVARHQIQKNIAMLQEVLSRAWEVLPDILLTSSRKKTGREALLYHIQQTLSTHPTIVVPTSADNVLKESNNTRATL
jgi:GTP-binding protein